MTLSKISSKGLFFKSALWLAPDHILQVKSNIISESYRRYYFSDIQSLVALQTSTGKVQNYIIGFYVAFLMILGLYVAGFSLNSGLAVIGTALFLLCLIIINSIKGPTCECYIKTPAQEIRLPGLNRIKKFHQFDSIVINGVSEKQGATDLSSIHRV